MTPSHSPGGRVGGGDERGRSVPADVVDSLDVAADAEEERRNPEERMENLSSDEEGGPEAGAARGDGDCSLPEAPE
eukprot:11106533-Alexandrium_andersonii.AAC.1